MPRWVPHVFVASLLLVVVWAVAAPQATAVPATAEACFAVIAIYVATFGTLAFNVFGRVTAVGVGAFGVLLIGTGFGFYFPNDAAVYLVTKVDTLILLAGVSAVTALVGEAGCFEVIAQQMLRSVRTDRRKVFVRLCIVTYVLSLFVNNLATILVIIPISLRIADELEMDAVSLVLGEVIASNLGGASTMVGDFPNMLIATDIGLPFHAFLLYLAPVAALQLTLMLSYLSPAFSRGSRLNRPPRSPATPTRPYDKGLALRAVLILLAMVMGFLLSGWTNISPAVVAGLAALAAAISGRAHFGRLVRSMHFEDIAFFICLFIMVGAVSATGVLDGLGGQLARIWNESPALGAIAIAWGAALITCFLNAGPTTALLIHVLVAGWGATSSNPAMWWALSLGVCAGSSATLTGATAGRIAAGLLERHGHRLTFSRFARTGIPLMLMFLFVSSLYLALLVTW